MKRCQPHPDFLPVVMNPIDAGDSPMKLFNHRSVVADRDRATQKIAFTLVLASLLASGLELVNTHPVSARSVTTVDTQISQLFPHPDSRASNLPPRVERAVLQDASRRSGVPVNRLRIVQASPRTFSNACQFNFGEVCTFEYRPIQGWEVIVQADRRQRWRYHVNRTGTQIAVEPGRSDSATLPAPARNAVLRDAAQQSGLPINALQITRVQARTFSNPCEFNFGERCTREYRPIEGWEVTVQGRGQSWNYHVSRSGYQVALDPRTGGTSVNLPVDVQQAILRDAAWRSGEPPVSLQIIEATPQTFGNPCIFNFGTVCTREYRPIEGYRVVVQVRRQEWTYHVDRTGSRVVLDPSVRIANPGFRWFR